MAPVSATRMNLMLRKEQARGAAEGATLLKSRREALLKEFLAATDTVLASRMELERRCRDAVNDLHLSRGREGPEALRSAALPAERPLGIEMSERHVWGIPLPVIRTRGFLRSPETRGYGVAGTAQSIEEAAEAYEQVLQQALESAMEEVRLQRIGGEIRKTSRRVNALEQILIPSLRREIRTMTAQLEERAREDIFRLKRLKARMTKRSAT